MRDGSSSARAFPRPSTWRPAGVRPSIAAGLVAGASIVLLIANATELLGESDVTDCLEVRQSPTLGRFQDRRLGPLVPGVDEDHSLLRWP